MSPSNYENSGNTVCVCVCVCVCVLLYLHSWGCVVDSHLHSVLTDTPNVWVSEDP